MILVKGQAVLFTLVTPEGTRGRGVKPPASYGILHDPDGKDLPRCTTYVGPVRWTREATLVVGKARAYFGRDYYGRVVTFSRPPEGGWKEIGPVWQIDYARKGAHKGNYYHPFRTDKRPVLYRAGRWFKLELGDGCIYNDRGFVFP